MRIKLINLDKLTANNKLRKYNEYLMNAGLNMLNMFTRISVRIQRSAPWLDWIATEIKGEKNSS